MYTGPLKLNRTYRAVRFRAVGITGTNDRTILWLERDLIGKVVAVQYDSDTVRMGAKFPTISVRAFRRWAADEAPEEVPGG